MNPELIYRLQFLSSLTEGPNGQPLFILTDIETPQNEPPRYRSRLATWDQGLRLLTQGEAKNPLWKGQAIYFLRKVEKAQQLFRLPLTGGEPEQITQLKAGVEGYKVSPDGSKIALLTRGDYQAPKPDEPRVYEDWPVKFDARGALPTQPREVWLLEGGQPRKLLGWPVDIEEVVWNSASDGLYLVAPGSKQEHWNDIQRAYWLDLEGRVAELFGGVGPISGLEPTPDGGLAYLAHAYEHGGGTEARLYHRALNGEIRLLAQGSFLNTVNSDMRMGSGVQTPRVGPDGNLYAVVTEAGGARLLEVTPQGECSYLTEAHESILGYAFCGDELYTLSETSVHGARLVKNGEVLFDPNAETLTGLAQPQPVSYTAPEGHQVPGWVLMPEGEGPHPLILYIHGGPHTAFGHALMLQLQLFRAAGFAVAYANPRGSTGYGQEFAALEARWGEVDEADLLGFLERVLEAFPVDPNRVGVAGGSYGGYMTNWLTARHPDRFRAAVTDRSICNWFSFFGASDIGPRFTWLELGATPWERPEVLWQKSPLSLVHQVRTPTLVVHSEQDHRCPIDQGETWYTLLLQKGVPTRFFRVPEEGHELSRGGRPDRRVARLKAYLEWWNTHLK
ncbi:S9 family peptidase [Meiothermus granaticius]|uniref:Dipeptidyl-peptidase 5 n=1 Tax=Meiothermus granaticius NBRC 107808 TaxID=1227551 RepID=A0A399FBD3_9DEIN|nr:S9 family peptidase [Meiothermus granaticius]RIH93917.1 Dipeptidyl-peptidase 5 [Meiothermus granaticius NBRC 107808]GEM87837.1 peptidase S9 [Meiothermus granaticius NBRC 107808]